MDFDALISAGADAIHRMVSSHVQENLNLDFKTGKMFRDGDLDGSNRKTIGEALSAFANATGGTLVIGVVAKKTGDIDCATEVVLVERLDKALTIVQDVASNALQPRHEAIRVHAVPDPTADNAGFIVIDVPRSLRRPHMSQLEHRYFKRVGASNFQMEHYEIEDAFRSTNAPELTLDFEWRRRHIWSTANDVHDMGIGIAIENIGRVTARDVIVQLWNKSRYNMLKAAPLDGPGSSTDHRHVRTVLPPPGLVVHPETIRFLHTVWFRIHWPHGSPKANLRGSDDGPVDLRFAYRISAENYRSEERELVIDMADIRRAIERIEVTDPRL